MSTTVGKIKYMKMTDSELKALGCTDIEEMISEDFGVPGTDEREAFDGIYPGGAAEGGTP